MKALTRISILFMTSILISLLFSGCFGKTNYLNDTERVVGVERVEVEEVEPPVTEHPLFKNSLGTPVTKSVMGTWENDETGLNILDDYDGDGIPNEEEITNNEYVSDYPRIVTRISPEIIMSIRVSETNEEENYTETIDEDDVKDTITDSMEERHYNELNTKTTPYITREGQSEYEYNMEAYGYEDTVTRTNSGSGNFILLGGGGSSTTTDTTGENTRIEDSVMNSSMAETTVFDDIGFIDNLDRNSITYTDEKIQEMSKRYRRYKDSTVLAESGPNDGYVKAALFIKNPTVNIPAHVSNIKCTLTFRTHSGKYLPIDTFYLRNEDYTRFEEDVYGNTEIGPFVIKIDDLNTHEVKTALLNGYVPQIHVVSYDLTRVEDSNYDYYPSIHNLKIVEETAKSRTAVVKIIAKDMRELYRVAAFDIEETEDPENPGEMIRTVSPGISLKKALFYIFQKKAGINEEWDKDNLDQDLTVSDDKLRWKPGKRDPKNHAFSIDSNKELTIKGNSWGKFETYIKKQVVDVGSEEYYASRAPSDRNAFSEFINEDTQKAFRYIETIKRIGDEDGVHYVKYIPFDEEDNPDHNRGDILTEEELGRTKYWVILHNGRYFNGDINDPIWVGDRFEIIFFEMDDFDKHFSGFAYTPIRTGQKFWLNTRWNRLSNEGDFARSVYLGKAAFGDVIKLEVILDESRFLFKEDSDGKELGAHVDAVDYSSLNGHIWYNFQYASDEESDNVNGIPDEVTYIVQGGINNFHLYIDETKNAQFYTVWFQKGTFPVGHTNNGDALVKKIRISPEELRLNNGLVFIDKNTILCDDEYTVLTTTVGSGNYVIDEGDYSFEVYAHGDYHGVDLKKAGVVKKDSSSIVHVVDPPDIGGGSQGDEPDEDSTNDLPEKSTLRAVGSFNEILVTINEKISIPLNTPEYYLLEVIGPFNYGNVGTLEENLPRITSEGTSIINEDTNYQTRRYINAHANVNKLFIPGPIDCSTDRDSCVDPGVYKVKVYGLNQNSPDITSTTEPDAQTFVYVKYERYAAQKEKKGRISNDVFNPKVVDLEVNFNDGSGWFAIRLSHDDQGVNDRNINCRYTNSIEQDKQKVTIYFSPPDGYWQQNPFYNVFRGGADEVDVYVRPVARPEYRDTIWPIKTSSIFDSAVPGYIYTNDILGYNKGFDGLHYWINHENTDAALIEDFLERHVYTDIADLTSVSTGDFGIVHTGSQGSPNINDFFFSPVEKRIYSISSSIVLDKDADIGSMMDETTYVDIPTFRLTPAEEVDTNGNGIGYFVISNLDAQYADNFYVYWKDDALTEEDINDFSTWDKFVIDAVDLYYNETHGKAIFSSKNDYKEEHYDANNNKRNYTVCILATNEHLSIDDEVKITTSSPVCKSITTYPLKVRYVSEGSIMNTEMFGPGFGTFGDLPNDDNGISYLLTNDKGQILRNYFEFQYGYNMEDGSNYVDPAQDDVDRYALKYDNGSISTDLTTGVVKIALNGKNLTDDTGLNLKPIAWDLSTIESPPMDAFYIDPVLGRFVIPRPSFWSKNGFNEIMIPSANYAKMLDPVVTITNVGIYNSLTSDGTAVGEGKLGDCYKFSVDVQARHYGENSVYEVERVLEPFKETDRALKEGTISFWLKLDSTLDNGEIWSSGHSTYGSHNSASNLVVADHMNKEESFLWFELSNVSNEDVNDKVKAKLYINNLEKTDPEHPTELKLNEWIHVYIMWDFDNDGLGLTGVNQEEQIKLRITLNNAVHLDFKSTENNMEQTINMKDLFLKTYVKGQAIAGNNKKCENKWVCTYGTQIKCTYKEVCKNWDSPHYSESYVYFDNPKIWTHLVSNDASWIYEYEFNGNSMGASNTTDGALHKIYGNDKGFTSHYSPDFKLDDGFAWYYY